MTYTIQQVIEVRAKLRLVNAMLARVEDDLGDLSIDGHLAPNERALFSKLSDATCEWTHVIDTFHEATAALIKA
jgi:hypothetical protein